MSGGIHWIQRQLHVLLWNCWWRKVRLNMSRDTDNNKSPKRVITPTLKSSCRDLYLCADACTLPGGSPRGFQQGVYRGVICNVADLVLVCSNSCLGNSASCQHLALPEQLLHDIDKTSSLSLCCTSRDNRINGLEESTVYKSAEAVFPRACALRSLTEHAHRGTSSRASTNVGCKKSRPEYSLWYPSARLRNSFHQYITDSHKNINSSDKYVSGSHKQCI